MPPPPPLRLSPGPHPVEPMTAGCDLVVTLDIANSRPSLMSSPSLTSLSAFEFSSYFCYYIRSSSSPRLLEVDLLYNLGTWPSEHLCVYLLPLRASFTCTVEALRINVPDSSSKFSSDVSTSSSHAVFCASL